MDGNWARRETQLLYQQVSEKTIEIIRSRKLQPHDPVPSESELAKLFGVSRMTTKLALELLAKQGLVYRLPRRGTFLANEGHAAIADETLEPAELLVPQQEVKKQNLIAIVVPNMDDYTSGIIAQVEQAAEQLDYEVLVKISRNPSDEDKILKKLVDVTKVSGIIIFPKNSIACSDEVLRLKLLRFPLVVIDRLFREIEIDSVYHNHYEGCYNLTKYLIDRGHRYIGFVSGRLVLSTSREERYQGYIQCLMDYSVPVNIRNIHLEVSEDLDGEVNSDLVGFLNQNKGMTAIVCSDDYIAARLMRAAYHLNLTIPDDLSLVGFSDIQFSSMLPVPLTTARQSVEKLAHSSVKLLVDRINQVKEGAITIKINTPIIERSSVKDLSKSMSRQF